MLGPMETTSSPHRPGLAWLVLCAALIPQCAHAQGSDPPMEKTIAYRVVVGADGKLVSALPLPSELGADIQRAAIGLARELRIEPASVAGKPVTAETTLSLTVQFNRQPDNGYQLGLKSARFGPEAIKTVPPVYRFRGKTSEAGLVALAVVVRPDGTVDGSQTRVLQSAIHGGNAAGLAKMVEAAIASGARWTYKPDLVAGKPVATMTMQLTRFCTHGLGGCDKPATPAPTAEMMALPRSMTPDQVLPALARSATAPVAAPEGENHYVQLRMVLDAQGKVGSARHVGKDIPAEVVEAARQKLLHSTFLPAQSAGQAVSSEMTVTVPVRDERAAGGGLRVQLERIRYDFNLMAAPFPWFPPEMSGNNIDARTRFRVVTGPDGRADLSKSKIEMIELAPEAAGIRRRLEANIKAAMGYIRVEPVLVDGKPISISFVRGMYFCSNVRRRGGGSESCAFDSMDEVSIKAMREPPTLPEGITLARLAP